MIEQSDKISCDNMRALAIQESQRNFYAMRNILSTPTVSYILPADQTDVTTTEHLLFKGTRYDKFACITKKADYGEGEWTKQFNKILPTELEKKYDITSKAKFRDIDQNKI
jgi:hypothetical protein